MDKQFLTRRASEAFIKGNYSQALNLYKEAADIYGESIFSANIILCERKLARTLETPAQKINTTIEQQLAKTQQLLEHYFNRAQELECQLIDKQQ